MNSVDRWHELKKFTNARIDLGRCGAALPTREVLKFNMAHALARDAVHTAIEWQSVETGLQEYGFLTTRVDSAAAPSRDLYLQRPDLGRKLSDTSRQSLIDIGRIRRDLAIVVGDGLSSTAVMANVVPLLKVLKPQLDCLSVAPIVLANQCRVALGDEVGEILGVRAVLMLIGERPGLSSPDSLGAYLTWGPRVGRKDADRNCVSNIRPGGLAFEEAAFRLSWLISESLRRQLSGVNLKDRSPTLVQEQAAAVESR